MQKTAEDSGVDYERIVNMNYSIEDVEKWETKQKKKADGMNQGFSGMLDLSPVVYLYAYTIDYAQEAAKKYTRLTNDLKPNLELYQKKKQEQSAAALSTTDDMLVNSLTFASTDFNKPSDEAVARMTADIKQQ